jgi:hypothetical protein
MRMDEDSRTPDQLSVRRIIRDTFLIPAQHVREFFVPLVLPGLLVAALTLGWDLTRKQMPATVVWTLYAVYGVLFTMLAVTCHRLVLLGPSPETSVARLRWGLRETKFLGWIVVLAAIFMAGRVLLMLVIANVSLWTIFRGTAQKIGPNWIAAQDYIAFALSA